MREHIQLLEVHSFVTVWASQVVLVVKSPPVKSGDVGDSGSIRVRKIPWRRAW